MTKARIPLVVGALVAAFLIAQVIVGQLVSWLFLVLQPGGVTSPGFTPGVVILGLLPGLLEIVVFGAGVYLSLRYVVPVSAAEGWKRVIFAGVIATLLGVAAVVVLGVLEAFLGASSISPYPFGYSFGFSLAPENLASRLPVALELGFYPLVNWIAPTVLATVLLRVWLGRKSAEVTAPAAAAAKPAGR